MIALKPTTRSYLSARLTGRAYAISSLVFCVLLILVATPGITYSQSVNAYVSEDSVRIGDRFYITLTATHESEQTPIFPTAQEGEGVFGDLEVLSLQGSGVRLVEGNTAGARVDSLVYEVTTFALDTAFVPSIPIYFAVNGDTSFYASRPLEIPVISVVTPDASDIRDIAPIIEFPRNVWPWILGLLLVAAIAVGLIYYLGRRPVVEEEVVVMAPSVPLLPPYDEAIKKLRGLEKDADLNDLLQVKPFYVELTGILRTYLGRRLNINAMESTSKELMQDMNSLAHGTNLPDESAYLTRRILHVSDLVKFADMQPRPEVGTQALMETRKVLDLIEASFKPVDAAPSPVEEVYDENKVEHAHEE